MAKIEKHNEGEPCWFDLMTPDRQGIKGFYSALFGWEFVDRDEAGMPYTMALRRGEPVAGIGTLEEGAPTPSAWTVYFHSPDIHASVATAKEAGVVVVEPTEVGPQGSMAICTDPEGAVFGLWQPGEHQGTAFIGDHGSLCWCEGYQRDISRGRSFYEKVLRARSDKMDAPGMTYFTLQGTHRDSPQAGLLQMTKEWGDMPAHWMAYFAVDDADAACAEVKSKGGEVKHGPFDTPFGRMAVVSDPAGAVLTVIKPPGQG